MSDSVLPTDDIVVYLLRKTSLTLGEIRELSARQFVELIKEVSYQESVEEYRRQYSVATILAAIASTIPQKHPRNYKAEDFLSGKPPNRNEKTLEELAKEKGIKLPREE